MVALMYFFMIRPQRKQQKKHQSMMSQLKPGDHVVTIGRLHGVVAEIDQQKRTVTLDCEGVYLVFDLGAIQRVEAQATEAPASAADADAEAEAKAEPTAKADAEQPAEPEEAAPAEKPTEDK